MIDKFWSYFEETGDIKVYLGLKEYEKTQNNLTQNNQDIINN